MATKTAAQKAQAAATRAARKAAGLLSVHAQRAANRAAKAAAAAGQPYTPPQAPPTSAPSQGYTPRPSRRSSRRSNPYTGGYTGGGFNTPPPPAAPVFATPKPTYRALRLAALAALEAAFVQKLTEQGITGEARDGYDKYKKLKALAINPASTGSIFLQNEADTALRMATIQLVKLAF